MEQTKKFICVIAVFLSSVIGVFSQSKKEVKDNNIKSTTENITATEGGKEINYKDSYIAYDKNGNITEQTEYNKDGSVKNKLTMKYDSFKNKTEELEYEGNNLKQKRQFSYNSNGDKTVELTLDVAGKLLKKEMYTYNNKGLRTEKKVYNSTNALVETHVYTYQK